MKGRYHRIDGWRGYRIPANAVAGASDTGMWEDSPAPSNKVAAEVRKVGRVLNAAGIKYRTRFGTTSNVFAGKRWIVVREGDFDRAARLMADYIRDHDSELRYVHDADLAEIGYR